jgi:putative peptidoglycan lipid II flippase
VKKVPAVNRFAVSPPGFGRVLFTACRFCYITLKALSAKNYLNICPTLIHPTLEALRLGLTTITEKHYQRIRHLSNKNKQRGILGNTFVVGLGTLASRVVGLVRDQVTAYYFGAGPVADAFFVAFRLPNFLRRLLAEGALTPAFIPVFSQRLKDEGISGAAALFRGAFTLMAIVLVILTVIGCVFAPALVTVLAPGFVDDEAQFKLTVTLVRVLFPYIFFMSLTALAMGALNTLGRFTVSALGPVALNITMILAAVFLSPRLQIPIMGLAIGVILGGALQLFIQLPQLWRSGPFLKISLKFKDPSIWKMFALMGPAALGGAAYQISILINTQLVSFLPEGSVSWLYYADRLVQFPLGIFSIALATAVLPALAHQSAKGDEEGFRKTLQQTVGLGFFITIPAVAGLIVMSRPLVELIFQRGEFDSQSAFNTTRALWAYVLGLPFLSGVSLMARAFYSRSNTKTPAIVASVSLAVGLAAAVGLMFPLKHVGLALASSLTSVVNFFWLALLLGRREGLNLWKMAKEALMYALGALIMGLALWPVYNCSIETDFERLWRIAVGLIAGPAIYFGLALAAGSYHLEPLKEFWARRKNRQK